MLVAELLLRACARRRRSGCPRRSRGSPASSGRARRPRCATPDSCAARAWRPGRCPAANSSASRTSTTATPSSISSCDLGGVDLLDLALDLAEQLRAGRAHLETPKPRSGFIDFKKYSAISRAFRRPASRARPTLSGDARTRPARPSRAAPARCSRALAAGGAARRLLERARPRPRRPRPPRGSPSASGFDGAALPAGVLAPAFTLTDQHGRRVVARRLPRPGGGRSRSSTPRCGATCVVIAQQIRGALDELRRAVPVLLVSADPAADTPRARRALPRARLAERAASAI